MPSTNTNFCELTNEKSRAG